MANAAIGWIEISGDVDAIYPLLSSLIHKHQYVFSYDCGADILLVGSKIDIHFTSRWSCGAAWDVIDDELTKDTPLSKLLFQSNIRGNGREDSAGYFEMIRKHESQFQLQRKVR
jgi:hypothetical protein